MSETETVLRLRELREHIYINGDGTATLPTADLSWALNELELWPKRAALAESPRETETVLRLRESEALDNLPGYDLYIEFHDDGEIRECVAVAREKRAEYIKRSDVPAALAEPRKGGGE